MGVKITMSLPFVSIITVNYNGKQYLGLLFESLYQLDYPKDHLEIIMVDNCSTDSSIEYVKKGFPDVKIIKNNINNYCRANNLGIEASKGEYAALINNDVKVDKNWLIELLEVISQDNRIAAVISKVLFLDGKIQGTGHYELPGFYWSDRGFKEEDKGQYDKVEEVISISHCCALYRKKCLEDIGLLDEDFNMFMEDVDMSIRARAKGWKIFYAPKSVAYHKFHGSIDTKSVDFYCEKNRLLLIAKHYPRKLAEQLYGSGYCSALNNRNDLIKILPIVFTKLIKHHSPEEVNAILPDIFESLNKILNLEKDYFIKQIENLKGALSRKDLEILNLNNSIIYKIVVKLPRKILSFFKKRFSFLMLRVQLWPFRLKNNLCLAYFYAEERVARYKKPNRYYVKITNDYPHDRLVKAKLAIERNNIIYAYFIKNLTVQPKTSLEVIVECDWQRTALWNIEGKMLESEELLQKIIDSSGFYELNVSLLNSTNIEVDKLNIFQKLEL